MKKCYPILILLAATLSSCAILHYNDYSYRIAKIELGMSKKEVIKHMGSNFIIAAAADSAGIKQETIAYKISDTEEYRFTIIDDRLISWKREFLPLRPQYIAPTTPPHL